jgi:hypothetical protein
MKRILLVGLAVLVAAFAVFPVVTAEAFDGDKAEALKYIESSLTDPEIGQWVESHYVSTSLFMAALKAAPERNVIVVAADIENFQANGGDLEGWWIIYMFVALFVTTAVIFAI